MNSIITSASTNFTTVNWLKETYVHIPLFSISVLLGLPTHSYVIWLILTGSANGLTAELFNLNHSFCEIGTSVDSFVFLLSICVPSLFPLALFLQGLSITGRPLFQCLMCVERYLAVVHPVTFLKYKPLRYRLICASVAWIFTLGSCLGCLIILFLSSVAVHSWFFSMQFLVYMPIQMFCLVAVLRALKQSGPGERTREKEENHIKRKAFHLILVTTVSTAVIYLPNTIAGINTFVTGQFDIIFWVPSMLCYVLAGFVQPLLFLHRAGKLSFICSS